LTLQPSASQKVFRRAHVWVALPIAFALGAAVAVFTTVSGSPGRALELKISDLLLRPMASLPAGGAGPEAVPITILGIDDRSLLPAYGGRWPWAWDRLAAVTDVLRDAGARLVMLDIEFAERDNLRVVEEPGPDGSPAWRVIETAPSFRNSIRAAGNVIVPFSVYIKGRPGTADGDRRPVTEVGRSDGSARSRRGGDESILAPFATGLAPDAAPGLWEAEDVQPMVPELAAVTAGSGYTTAVHDAEDGVVRRVPLLARTADRVFSHLMLHTAGLWQFGRDYRVRLADGRLYLQSADGTSSVGVPVDEHAQVETRWPTNLRQLHIISIIPVLQLAKQRQRYFAAMRQLDEVFPEEGWAAARKAINEAFETAAAAGRRPSARELADLASRLKAVEERLAMKLIETAEAPDAGKPADAKARRLGAIAAEHAQFLRDYYEPDKGHAAGLKDLLPHIQGRLCIVGYYATGIADMHTTPIGNAQPGVTIYPAGIRTILSGVAFSHLPRLPEGAIIVLVAGLVVLTLHLSTWRGVAAMLALSLLVVAAAMLASWKGAVLLPVAGPVLGIVLAFAGVTSYRQLTEASSRRWITRAFEQYTGAEHVDELLRDPERLRLGGERRPITFLFSDIAGFTTLSEKYEPEKLVRLLNRYLSVMTEIFMAESGALDKYEGDAILAMFGAPIPLPDHALRAVRAALAMHEALPRVNRELVEAGLLAEGTRLGMRIGCSSGPAIVGNFGSEQRFNYTAMGDTINLGARLEEANRWLGSRILVPEPTAAACAGAVLFRRFGPARIRGKNIPAVLYEPLALEPAPEDLRRVADAFGRAIDALQTRNMDAAEAALAELLAARPDDKPAQVLKERIAAMRAGKEAPDEPWNLAKPK
jgi:class 3 adenylate cyclase/CHASE2 domain-containing sensor protein